MRGVSDAFAVFAYDDSMHPMYKNGQTLWVHPHLPVKPGDVWVIPAGTPHGGQFGVGLRGAQEIGQGTEDRITEATADAQQRVVGGVDDVAPERAQLPHAEAEHRLL